MLNKKGPVHTLPFSQVPALRCEDHSPPTLVSSLSCQGVPFTASTPSIPSQEAATPSVESLTTPKSNVKDPGKTHPLK